MHSFGPSDTFVFRRRDAQLTDNGSLECLVRIAPFASNSATDPSAFIQSRATTEPPSATDEEQQLSSLLVEALSPAVRLVLVFFYIFRNRICLLIVQCSSFHLTLIVSLYVHSGMLSAQCNFSVCEHFGRRRRGY